MDRYTGPPIRFTILVRQIANVLDARGLGTLLRRVDTELPSRTARKREHKHMGHRMCKHDQAGGGGYDRGMGTRHATTDSLGSREAAGEARGHDIRSGSKAGRKEGVVKLEALDVGI